MVIDARRVSKNYGSVKAVDSVSFSVEKGECFGLLGPNGAGKSSLMRMMYGASRISGGELHVNGFNAKSSMRKIKASIGVVPQQDGLDPDFSVLENLLIFAKYHNLSAKNASNKAWDLLRFARLDEFHARSVESLSGGMQRRLSIARGLINDPEILFLDEPTTGLDPQARLWIWQSLRSLKEKKKSIFITTHYMEEAETLCDRVAIIDHGKILEIDSPKNLIARHIGNEVVELSANQEEMTYFKSRLQELDFTYQSFTDRLSIYVKPGQSHEEVLNRIPSRQIEVRKANLNDVFLALSGVGLRDE